MWIVDHDHERYPRFIAVHVALMCYLYQLKLAIIVSDIVSRRSNAPPVTLSLSPLTPQPRLGFRAPCLLLVVRASSGQSDASPMTSVVGSSSAVRESSGWPPGRWLGRFPCLDDRGSRPSISDPICRLVGFWWILLAVSVFSLFCYSSDEICVVFEIDFGAPSRNLRRSTVHFGHRTEAENSRASLVRFSFVIYP